MIQLLNKNENLPYELLLLADESMDAINKYIHNSDIFALKENNIIIAVYVLQTVSDDTIEIKNIAVRENHQGQGIGQMLLNHAVSRAKEIGMKWIIIGTGDASIKQLYIYQKAGFEMYEIRHNFFLENYPNPIFENGLQLKHMVMLKMNIDYDA